MPTNTEVIVRSENGEWCEISAMDGTVKVSGFVACRFLGQSKLEALSVQRQLEIQGLGESTALDLLQEKFWVSPSPMNLLLYGQALDKKYFPRETEDQTFSMRPARAEFEAMRQFLMRGWAPADFDYSASARHFEPAVAANLALPEVSPSLFRNEIPDLIVAPYVGKRLPKSHFDKVFMANTGKLIDETLRRHDLESVRVAHFAGPLRRAYGGVYSAWGIGGYTIAFGSPGIEVLALNSDGSSLENTVTEASTESVQYGAECDQIGETITLASPLPDNVVNNGVLAFVEAPKSFGITKAQATLSVTKPLSEVAGKKSVIAISGGKNSQTYETFSDFNAFLTAFDLNGDGIADIAFEGIADGPRSNDLVTGPKIKRVFFIFINLNGKWVKFASFEPLRCAS